MYCFRFSGATDSRHSLLLPEAAKPTYLPLPPCRKGDSSCEAALPLQATFKPLPNPNRNKMTIRDRETDAAGSHNDDADTEKVIGAMPTMKKITSERKDSKHLYIVPF